MTRTWTAHRSLWLLGALLAVAALLAMVKPAHGDTDADLRAGVYTEPGSFGVGGGVLTGMGTGSNWFFNPNLEAAFGDSQDQVALNADFHYDFPTRTSYTVYMGAGPALLFRHPDRGEDDTAPGVNVIGGMAGRSGQVRPFVQMKGVVSDRGEVALVGGIRF